MNDYPDQGTLTGWYVELARLHWTSRSDCPEKREWLAWYQDWLRPDGPYAAERQKLCGTKSADEQ